MVRVMASVSIVPSKRAMSQMWCYVLWFSWRQLGSDIVVCRLCPDNEFPYARNTMNLVTHLNRHHKTEYSNYLKAIGKSTNESSLSSICRCVAIGICAVIVILIYRCSSI